MKNVRWALGMLSRHSRWLLPTSLALALVAGVSPLLGIVLPKLMVDELLTHKRPAMLALFVAALAVGTWVFATLRAWLLKHRHIEGERALTGLNEVFYQKADQLSLDMGERKSTLDLVERSRHAQYALHNLLQKLEPMGGALLSFAITFLLLAGSEPWLLAGLTVLNLLTLPIANRTRALDVDYARRNVVENRSFRFFVNIAEDFRYAKDLRLTGGQGLMLKRAEQNMDRIISINHQYFTQSGFWAGLAAMALELQTALAFGLLAVRLFSGAISPGDFMLLFSAARQYCAAGKQALEFMVQVSTANLEMEPLFDYLHLATQQHGAAAPPPEDARVQQALSQAHAGTLTLEARDLWFTYPTQQEPILKGVSFTLHAGETLALVGRNGAGKSTLIKLLCRFYEPDSGQLLLNGVPAQHFPLASYRQLLGCAFQDFSLLPVQIRENVLCKASEQIDQADDALLQQAFERLELEAWLAGLPQGDASYYSRKLDPDGILPSGGQAQKLALARAIARNGSLLMMDEPTAALDPRAEEEVFRVMLREANDMTALFISHRLSSTRHADRIIVMEQGRITEEGSHQALMRLGGLYANMYGLQAEQYIQETEH